MKKIIKWFALGLICTTLSAFTVACGVGGDNSSGDVCSSSIEEISSEENISEEISSEEISEAHTHTYTAQTTTGATCTEKGVITYTCSCNDTYTEEIPALGHEYALYVENFDEHGESLGTETAECLHGCGTKDERLIEYTLICIADGETVAEKTFTIETEDFDLPEIPEREGYSSKWGDIEYLNGEFFVIAEYTPITYTITYVLNGGTNSETNPATYTIESGAIPLYKPTKTYGTTFVNWYTDENFSEESKVLTIPKRSHGDITLYAKWIDYRIEVAEYFDIDYTQSIPVLYQEVHNATVNMDLNSEIIVSDGCTWALYSDFEGRDKYPLKAMTLKVGLNQAYVIVNHPDGEHFTRYLLSIYRLDMKPYSFMNGLSVYDNGIIEEKSTVNAPAVNPTQTGYAFQYWSVYGQKVTFPYKVLTETTFVAEYTPITYSITYRLNGGTNSSYNPTSYTIEDTKYLENPTRTGYTFGGWYTESTFVNPVTAIIPGTYGNKTLYAKWTPIPYNITYQLNGGTQNSANVSQYNIESNTITLVNPTREHYTFSGWYKESNFVNKVTQITKGSYGHKTFYAKWTPTPYTITYQLNGGTNNSANVRQYNIESNTITLASPTRAGYTFNGWYTESTFTNKITQITKGSYGNKTLYAKWTANSNTLQFNGNGATGGSMSSVTVKTDATYTLKANAFTRTDYEFIGWATTPDGEVVYEDTAVYTMGTDSTYTLYAKWICYTVTTNTNMEGAGTYTQYTQEKITVGKTVTLTATTNTGYTWLGWYRGEERVSTSTSYSFTMEKEEYVFTAKWICYTVTTNANMEGAGTYTQYTQEKITVGKTVTLTATTNTGYTWLGWYRGGERVSTSTSYSFTMEKEEYVFTAKWDIIKYNITYHLDGGTNHSANPQYISLLSSLPITLKNPTKDGYVFKGWYTNSTLTTSITTLSSLQTYTVYAKWEIVKYNITYQLDGGTNNSANPQYITHLSTLPMTLKNPTKEGYTFKGWYTNSGLTTSITTLSSLQTYTVYAKWEYGSDGLQYSLSNSQYTVTGYTGTDKNVIIPSVYNGYPVTSIGGKAFYNCDSLTSVEIGDSVTSIGNSAFYNCDSLTSMVIGDSVTIIGSDVFACCRKLTSITVSANNTKYKSIDGNLYSKDGKTLIQYAIGKTATSFTIPDSVTSIGERAFYYCTSLTSVVIGDSVTSIGSSAFYNCDSLTSVVIPNSVTIIGEKAFYNCDSLTSVEIGDSVTSIGNSVFYHCDSLTSMVIGDSVTIIGSDVFAYCRKLTRITVSANNTKYKSIDGNLYSKDGKTLIQYAIGKTATSFTIPDSVTSIGERAFYDCDSLTSVVIGDSVTSIGNSVFYHCDSLTSVVISDSVTSIGEKAFYSCDSLTSVEIPDSVTSIGSYAFYNCDSLTKVNYTGTIDGWAQISFASDSANPLCRGASLYINDVLVTEAKLITATKISNYVFYNCGSLTSVEIPDSVTSIGSSAFSYCDSLTSVVIPNSVTSIGNYAFYSCSSLTIYCEVASKPSGWNSDWNFSSCPVVWDCNDNDVASDGYIYTVIDGIRYGINNGKATVVGQSANITTATIPASITYKETSYPVTSIGNSAFGGCNSLTSVEIGDSVTSIGSYAFKNCDSLTSVVIGDSVTSIGYEAFYSCDSLTSVVIGDSVTSVGSYAFEKCSSLTSVVIGDSVESIGGSAFSGCGSLTSVYYKGTASGWSGISIGFYNSKLTSATRYDYIENEADVPTDGGNYWHYVNGVPTKW